MRASTSLSAKNPTGLGAFCFWEAPQKNLVLGTEGHAGFL